ncbi:MAG TPA: ABC transporter permease, partial [Lachnospiraceae bacterium]|nr:ABC transporter permease [Lachnospiraceae bacterium]
MTVFKSYMQMVKKNLGMVLMYFGIFIGIAIAMSIAGNKGTTGGFSAEKVDMAIVDLDKSELSKQLITFLKEKHNVAISENDKSKLSEELYYEKWDIVLQIEEGFSEAALDGKNGIHMTQRPGSYNG